MINNLNRTDCCTMKENLVLIEGFTAITNYYENHPKRGMVFCICKVCSHGDYYPAHLFTEAGEVLGITDELVEAK